MAKINKICGERESVLFQIMNFAQVPQRFNRFFCRQIPLRHRGHFETDHKLSNRGRSEKWWKKVCVKCPVIVIICVWSLIKSHAKNKFAKDKAASGRNNFKSQHRT